MADYLVPSWILYTTVSFIFSLFGGLLYYLWKYYTYEFNDKLIILHKTGRFTLMRTQLKNLGSEFHLGNQIYKVSPEAGILNRKGKALYIYSEGNPVPMQLAYNKASWLDSGSLHAVINNDLIKKILQPTTALEDGIILIGAIGGIIAGCCSLVVLLKVLGVF